VISKLEHMALSVADLETSIRFYRDLLGLKLIREQDCDADSTLGVVVGLPKCRARIAHLMCGETMLELFEYINPRGKPLPEGRPQSDHGFIHVGFQSTDVRGDYQRLSEQGIRFISEPIEFRPGVWIVYFYGPDGEVCELRETPGGQTGA
jgi:catechol 2,3-dioxygenase-like lactoylglutathione lyase family enzyme